MTSGSTDQGAYDDRITGPPVIPKTEGKWYVRNPFSLAVCFANIRSVCNRLTVM
jgi:hypothetical protein